MTVMTHSFTLTTGMSRRTGRSREGLDRELDRLQQPRLRHEIQEFSAKITPLKKRGYCSDFPV